LFSKYILLSSVNSLAIGAASSVKSLTRVIVSTSFSLDIVITIFLVPASIFSEVVISVPSSNSLVNQDSSPVTVLTVTFSS
jgi:hypothetical protein